jgi:glycosyltransferase involved in cell wall biosynthesis
VSWLGPARIGPSPTKLFLDGMLVFRTIALLARQRYDFVHAHEEAVFFCRYLRPIFRFKLVYDMHSSLPQQLSNFHFTRSRLLIGLFEKLEDTCLARADAVITICPALADYAIPRMPEARRHVLIENSLFEEVRLKGAPHGSDGAAGWARQLPDGRRVVAYAGTFEPYQGLDLLVAAFAEVVRRRPEAFLLMIGGAPEQVAQYQRLARERGIDGHCLFTGRVDQGVARALLERAAVLTSPRSEGDNTPLKIYEQLASGKPLVATRIHSHTQVLDDTVCFLAEPQPDALARAILGALDPGPKTREVVAGALALYAREYSPAAYEKKMRTLLEILR